MTSRKWKAFMRLTGETMDDDQEVVKEFTEFAQQLERVGIDYSIVVSVSNGSIRQYSAKINRIQPIASTSARRYVRPLGD